MWGALDFCHHFHSVLNYTHLTPSNSNLHGLKIALFELTEVLFYSKFIVKFDFVWIEFCRRTYVGSKSIKLAEVTCTLLFQPTILLRFTQPLMIFWWYEWTCGVFKAAFISCLRCSFSVFFSSSFCRYLFFLNAVFITRNITSSRCPSSISVIKRMSP